MKILIIRAAAICSLALSLVLLCAPSTAPSAFAGTPSKPYACRVETCVKALHYGKYGSRSMSQIIANRMNPASVHYTPTFHKLYQIGGHRIDGYAAIRRYGGNPDRDGGCSLVTNNDVAVVRIWNPTTDTWSGDLYIQATDCEAPADRSWLGSRKVGLEADGFTAANNGYYWNGTSGWGTTWAIILAVIPGRGGQ